MTSSRGEGGTGLRRLRAALDREDLEVVQRIAVDDAMNPYGEAHYFRVGRSALRCIELALLAAGKEEVNTILDFPSGYGRVLRMLKAAFPAARLTACDVSVPMAEFCGRRFGAMGVVAGQDAVNIPKMGPFDLIWCGSLMTHLAAERWQGYLDSFAAMLAPEGVLVFSTHGRHVVGQLASGADDYGLDRGAIPAMVADYERDGFGYLDYPGMSH